MTHDIERWKKTVTIDLDDTVCHQLPYPAIGGLIPEARESLKAFQDAGLFVMIHTGRVSQYWMNDHLEEACKVADYLNSIQLPHDSIWTGHGKPMANWYVDNRGVRFQNNWEFIREQVITEARMMGVIGCV